MKNLNIDQVLTYLKSSKQIESVLKRSYQERTFAYNKRGIKNKHLPLFNKALYEQTIKLKRLPSVEEYEKYYIAKYSARVENIEPVKFHANKSYISLVTDLHFYFILKESNLFDEVRIDYIHDIEAKTDILLEKEGFKMGLQLFSGNENYKKTKEHSIQNLNVKLGYELYLFSLDSADGRRIEILDTKNKSIYLYSTQDAQFLAKKIKQIKQIQEDDIVEESGQLDTFEKIEEIPNLIESKDNIHSVIFGGFINADLKKKAEANGAKVFYINKKVKGITPFTIIDGKGYEKYEDYLVKYGDTCPGFNFYQYAVEHATPDENLSINAGAGSGKTTTLVSRILFLLNTEEVKSIEEIAMITFTNEAANNMEKALTDKFLDLYKRTGNQRYHRYLQDLRRMQVMTIPTFAKFILKEFGHYIGLGEGLKVSPLQLQREKIVEKCLDETIINLEIDNPFDNLPYYKAIDMILTLWNKFQQKGVIDSDLAKQVFEDDEYLNEVIVKTIILAEERFNDLKIANDLLTVSDLTLYLKKLIIASVPLEKLESRIKFLFVDEFQDTDIAQIQFIANIAKRAKMKLTVVGDVKQSIYRFRGANSTAFTVLNEYLDEIEHSQTKDYNLYENFRSSKDLINCMEHYFKIWRKHKLLPQKDQPMYSRKENTISQRKSDYFAHFNNEMTSEVIKNRFTELPEDGDSIMGILVRTNEEAKKVGQILSEIEGIDYEVRMNGTLFMSQAARDLQILIKSWIFPQKKDIAFGLSTTAFSMVDEDFKFRKITKNNKIYISGETFQFIVPKFWLTAQELFKYKPTLTVLNEFIDCSDYKKVLRKRGYKDTEIIKYDLNLQKILSMIHNQFNAQSIDLITLYEWLNVQVMTNREVDEAVLEDSFFEGNFIRVLTVHKSKGLEFHTVLIPFTTSKFIKKEAYVKNEFIVQIGANNKLDYGWKYIDDEYEFYSETNNYSVLKNEEDYEQRCEETRLLYVAMTRAKQRLFIYNVPDNKRVRSNPDTWGELLMLKES